MSEALKERKEMDPQYQWDLTKMYASDAEWEKAFAAIDPKIEALAAWEGKLNNAASIREFYDAEIGVFRELENLAVYTSLRLSEDTRADDAQSMDARATAKYVKAVGTIAYAQPEILALPQETLDAIMADEQVAPIVCSGRPAACKASHPDRPGRKAAGCFRRGIRHPEKCCR